MINGKLVDFTNDEGRQLLNKIAIKHPVPDYVLACDPDELNVKLAGAQVAVVSPQPALPCHNKAACWLSHAYYLEQRDSLDSSTQAKIERHLAKQAKFWGIATEVEEMVVREGELMKQAAYTEELYPVRNLEEAQQASQWLMDNYASGEYTKIAIEDRVDLAGKLLDAEGEFGYYLNTEVRDTLRKAAGREGCLDGSRLASQFSAVADPYASKFAAAVALLRGEQLQRLHGPLAKSAEQLGVFAGPAELGVSGDAVIANPVEFPSGTIFSANDIAVSKAAAALLVNEKYIGDPTPSMVKRSVETRTPATLNQVELLLVSDGVPTYAPPRPIKLAVMNSGPTAVPVPARPQDARIPQTVPRPR